MRRGVVAIAVCSLVGCGRSAPVAPPSLVAPAAPPEGPAVEAAPRGALPGDVGLTAVDLELEIDPATTSYRGVATLHLALTRPTPAVWLHALDLEVTAASATAGGRAVPLGWTTVRDAEVVGLAAAGPLPAGAVAVTLRYRARFGEKTGLFRRKVRGADVVFSDLEPLDARRAFPCLDEPHRKPRWRLSLVVPEGEDALSNYPEIAREPAGAGRTRVRFAETRPLPSYLVALAVGPLEVHRSQVDPRIAVVAPAGRGDPSRALAVTPRLLAAAEAMFDEPMPFPKLDLIAVPGMNGAMENPGLVTFGSHILLPELDGATPELVAASGRLLDGIIAHEIAHLWLGDLVSPREWRELWLNEGLATWTSEVLLAALDPAARERVIEVADQGSALEVDRFADVRAVRAATVDRAATEASFDAIAYRKGGAIVATLEAWLGRDALIAGLRRYLAAHRDDSARTADLVAALDPLGPVAGAAGQILDGLLERPGLPLVDLALECGGAPAIVARARPYRGLGDPPREARFTLPVCVAPDDGEPRCALVGPDAAARIALPRCPATLRINPGELGYRVTAMTPELLARAAAAPMSERERVGFRRNLRLLLEAGEVGLAPALSALRVPPVASDRDALELIEVADLLAAALPAALPRLEAAIAGSLRPAGERLPLIPPPGDDSSERRAARVDVHLARATALGRRDPVRRHAEARAAEWLAGRPRALAPDDPSLRVAASVGGAALFERVAAALDAAGNREPERAMTAAAGLGSFRQPALFERAIERLGSAPLDARPVLLRSLASNPLARPALLDRLAADGAWLTALPVRVRPRALAAFRRACTAAQRDGLARLARTVDATAIAAELAREIDRCIAVRARYADEAARLTR